MCTDPLKTRRILVVEDEYFLMMDLCDALQKVGAVVVGPAPSVEAALALVASEPDIDVALLDINLGGEMVYPVADALGARGVPYVFSTGYDDGVLNRLYPGIQRCEKPVEFRLLAQALAAALVVC